MIGLDAAEPRLIEAGMAEGWLPNLRELRERGAYGRLASPAEWLAASPWPTFYTGTGPEEHGLYHWQQWRAEKMWLYRCDPAWLPMDPFWRSWGADQPRVIAIDVPMTYLPKPFNGIEVCGWASHDRLVPPASYPPEVMDRIAQDFGAAPLSKEVYARQPLDEVLAIRDELISVTERVAQAASALMDREAWDLFVLGFGTTHRGGHKLWDETGLLEKVCPGDPDALPRALRDVYAACDTAIGRLVEQAGADTTVLVFSLHGMGPNVTRVDVLDEMLNRIFGSPSDPHDGTDHHDGTEQGDALQRLREKVPLRFRSLVKDNLPFAWQEFLTRFWRRRKVDWSVTQAFAPDADLHGYIRINLRGRERLGIVEPGEPFERVCAQIEEGLRSFVDADTGEPVVAEVARPGQLFPAGARRGDLPDLLVRWSDSPAAQHRALHSDTLGTIPWPEPGRNRTGRGGNHRGEGFLVAVGQDVTPGACIHDGHVLDLAPTVHALLGVDVPAHMRGRSLVPC